MGEVPGLNPNCFVQVQTLSKYALAEVLPVKQVGLVPDHVLSLSFYITPYVIRQFNPDNKKINFGQS